MRGGGRSAVIAFFRFGAQVCARRLLRAMPTSRLLQTIFQTTFLGEPLARWLLAAGIALATPLAALRASVSIVIDKPFVLGDMISAAAVSGTVESIGLKTTRLRSLSGEQIVFANGDLLKGRIRNLQRMTERRVTLAFGIAQTTP